MRILEDQNMAFIPWAKLENPPPPEIMFLTVSNLFVALPKIPSRLPRGTRFLKLPKYVSGFNLSPNCLSIVS